MATIKICDICGHLIDRTTDRYSKIKIKRLIGLSSEDMDLCNLCQLRLMDILKSKYLEEDKDE